MGLLEPEISEMAGYSPLTKVMKLAVRFAEADTESRVRIESEFQKVLDRYPSKKDDLLKVWNALVSYIQKHKSVF